MTRYFVTKDSIEFEVTKEEFMRFEKEAGFHSFTPNEPATAGFSQTKSGRTISGRLKYGDDR